MNLATICQVDRRIKNYLIPVFDAGANFDGRAEVARDLDTTDVRNTIFDHRDAQPIR